jgi:hypothetical protein
MENQIDIIEKQIEQLKESIMNRYNESIRNIERDISYSKETALDRVLQTRIEFRGSRYDDLSVPGEGKWKVLILAKRIV